MNKLRSIVRDERGVALIVALVALIALSALVVAFLAVGAYEPQISRNLVNATRARYLAEAGLESAYDTLIANTNWDSFLTSATCTSGTTGVTFGTANSALPGLTSASGTYTVSIRNDCQTNDGMLTGVTADASGTTDTNDHVILTAVGTFGSATRTITVVVTRVGNLFSTSSPSRAQLNAALSFPGYESDTLFSGDSFVADGRNHDLTGAVTTGSAVYGISVGPENQFTPTGGPVMQHEINVQNSLSSVQKDNLTGKNQTSPSTTTIGDNTVAADLLTSASITDFVNVVKNYADVTINSTQANPATAADVGSTCGSNYSGTNCWGTSAQPKIVYVRGDVDTTSAFNAMRISGTSSGYGILIIEDGDLSLTGTFNWEGPIIVTGGYVGVGFSGSGTQNILGALVSNETATNEASGFYEGLVQGSASVKYSRAALDKALVLLGTKITGTGGSAYVKVNMYNFREQ